MKITQAFTFEAAHVLPHVPLTHRCLRMHGHSYRVELRLEGPVDAATGFVIDFFDVEAAFAPLLAKLDKNCLNEVRGPRKSDRREHRDLDLEAQQARPPAARPRHRLRDARLLGRI